MAGRITQTRRAAIATAASAALLAGALGATAAPASRAATAKERAAMAAAALKGVAKADRAKLRVSAARVSGRSQWWGMIRLVPAPGFEASLDGFYAIVLRRAGQVGVTPPPGPWIVIDAGTSGVACPIAPVSVLKTLGVDDCGPPFRL